MMSQRSFSELEIWMRHSAQENSHVRSFSSQWLATYWTILNQSQISSDAFFTCKKVKLLSVENYPISLSVMTYKRYDHSLLLPEDLRGPSKRDMLGDCQELVDLLLERQLKSQYAMEQWQLNDSLHCKVSVERS